MKKYFVIAEYPIFLDPPTKNLCLFLSEKGNQVIVVYQGKIGFTRKYRNLIVKSIPEIFFYKNTAFVKLINILIRFIYIRIILSRNTFDHIFLYQYKNIALFPTNKYKNWVPIITDIHGIINIGKFDFYFRKFALLKLSYAKCGWVSDEFKLELLEQHSTKKLINFKVVYNCPRLSYLKNYNLKSKNDLRLELSNLGFQIGSIDDIVITRAGGNVKFGGIEETILALKNMTDKIKFIIIGKCDIIFKESILKMVSDLKMEKRVFMYGFVEDVIYEKILSASDLGHMIHLEPLNDKKLLDNYKLNSSLSNNRLFQYIAAGLPIISYNDERLNEIHNELGTLFIVDKNSLINSLKYIFNFIVTEKFDTSESSQKLKTLFKDKYNWENQFKKLNINI
jgi:glycosyltransferase involved in cell wall biosynthesis